MQIFHRVCALIVGIVAACLVVPGNAAADPVDFGGGCVLYTDNPAATVDALRFRCNADQYNVIYGSSGPGAEPLGPKNGWVLNPPVYAAITPGIWMGKTFYPGYLRNRMTGAQLEAFHGAVYIGPSYADGRPTWFVDYAWTLTGFLHDEVREVTPGVYLGFAHNTGGSRILTFVLA